MMIVSRDLPVGAPAALKASYNSVTIMLMPKMFAKILLSFGPVTKKNDSVSACRSGGTG